MRFKITFTVWILSLSIHLIGQPLQELSLVDAYQMLQDRYPILQNEGLFAEQSRINLDLIEINQMPQVHWKTEGRLQSESVSLQPEGEVMLPFEIDLPLYSLKTYVEGQYVIADGGLSDAKSAIEAANLQTKTQQLKVQEFQLRDQINQLFLGILNLRAQQDLLQISIQDFEEKREVALAGLEQGVLLPSEVDKLDIGILKLETQDVAMLQKINGLIQRLEYLIGVDIDPTVNLELPAFIEDAGTFNRPEFRLYDFQKQGVMAQSALIDVEKKPMLSAFAQAGIGYPNPLNLLDNGVAPYGIVGLQMNWKILDWEKSKKRKELLQLKIQEIKHQEETFRFNLDARHADFQQQVTAIEEQMQANRKILSLEEKILQQYQSQYDEGVIGSTEYIDQVNKILKAKQDLSIYEIELLQIKLNYYNDLGAY